VFFFLQLCAVSSNGNPSKTYLAKFGDIQNMKLEKVLHTHPFHMAGSCGNFFGKKF
jgi:hypothetical protein